MGTVVRRTQSVRNLYDVSKFIEMMHLSQVDDLSLCMTLYSSKSIFVRENGCVAGNGVCTVRDIHNTVQLHNVCHNRQLIQWVTGVVQTIYTK